MIDIPAYHTTVRQSGKHPSLPHCHQVNLLLTVGVPAVQIEEGSHERKRTAAGASLDKGKNLILLERMGWVIDSDNNFTIV